MVRRTLSARELVCEHLAEVIPRFPDLPIGGPALDGDRGGDDHDRDGDEPFRAAPAVASGLPPHRPSLAPSDLRDAALVRALDGTVRRRWLTLEQVLAANLARPIESLEPRVRAALLVGAAQLLLFDRIPDHAAVDEAVSYARETVRPGAGGFVNGVLRSTARLRDAARRVPLAPAGALLAATDLPCDDGTCFRLPTPLFAAPQRPEAADPHALALQTSLAPALVERWWSHLGPEQATTIALGTIVPAPTIIRNPPLNDPRVQPHRKRGFGVFAGAPRELAPLLAAAPDRWVQDPTSAAAVDAVAERLAPRLIIDLCAGRGTKTRQLAARFPDARILACDPDPERASILRTVFRDSTRVEVVATEAIPEHVGRLGGADLVLLDVPCSNSGVLARRLEARYRFDPHRLQNLVTLQRRIIASGAALLAARAALLYCTCSLEPEENQRQWEWIESGRFFGRPDEDAALPAPAGGRRLRRSAAATHSPSARPGGRAEEHRDGGAWALFLVEP